MKLAIEIGIVLLVALAITIIPGGGPALNGLLTVLIIGFFVAIAFFGYRLYREHRFTLDSMETRTRLVLYGSVALAFLTFAATQQLFDAGGVGVLAWLALLALCSYGGYWVYMRVRSYE
jgi:uncharacterized protein involved in cysteine biosynthesis